MFIHHLFVYVDWQNLKIRERSTKFALKLDKNPKLEIVYCQLNHRDIPYSEINFMFSSSSEIIFNVIYDIFSCNSKCVKFILSVVVKRP